MRQGLAGAVMGALVSAAMVAAVGQAQTNRETGNVGAGGMQVTVDGGHLYIVDAERRWFGVYQVDSATGSVVLKAARNFEADTKLQQYGEHEPTVEAVRRMVGQER